MRKRVFFVFALLSLCLVLAGCAPAHATADGDTESASVDAADVALISEKMGISYAEAHEIYEILRGLGMSEGVKYVTSWTESESGEKYYRIRTTKDVFDYYPKSGEIRNRDGSAVYGGDTAVPETEATDGNETDGETTREAFAVVLNTNTEKYHYPGCKSIDAMKESNKKTLEVTDVSELFDLGYEPCAVCAADDHEETKE